MFNHFLKVTLRNIKRNKLFSFINVFGLSVALAFCVLIYFYVKQESNFDTFNKNADHLYVLVMHDYSDVSPREFVYMPTPFAKTLAQELPAVEHAVRFNDDNVIVSNGDKVFSEDANFTDADFFKTFSFPLIEGNAATALADLNDVVLTPDLAKKYFGNQDPMGKELSIRANSKEENYIVTGIAQAPPANSSITFNLLLRDEKIGYYDMMNKNWQGFNTATFVKLADNTSPAIFQRQLNSFVNKYLAKSIKSWQQRAKMPADKKVLEVTALPLKQLHFASDVEWSNSSDPKYIFILSGIALLILIIACINYISLSLTSASGRMTEIGVRKVVGAERGQLIRQLWGESLVMGLIALVFSLILVKLFLPVFNELTNKNFSLGISEFSQAAVFLFVLLAAISFVTGGYPAFFLSSFQPAKVLKGRNTYRLRPGLIKGLVVVQYALSAFLIIGALVMYRQMKFVSAKDLGYDKNQLIVIPTYSGNTNDGSVLMNRLREELKSQPDILSVTGTSDAPSNPAWDVEGYTVNGQNKEAFTYRADYDFIPTLGIKLAEGRNFSRDYSTDTTDAVIVNEALVQDMGWKNPIGQPLPWMGDEKHPSHVIGVVKDFNFLSLESQVKPMLLYINSYNSIQTILIRISPNNIPQTINLLQDKWKTLNPGKPFNYSFQDEDVAQQYAQYQRWVQIMMIATIIAVLIASLGLFGLAGIMALNRTKEIGIRKVFGAGIKNILVLLNKDIVILSVVSFVIAMPVAWYVMNQWLQNFAYRISITWDIPFIAIIAALTIALLTVSYHTLKAAIANPVKSLRTE
jgi:putative ABC transport system permease protein